MKKIIIGICLLFLLIGSVTAFEINNLKPIDDYSSFDGNGQSNYTTNQHRYFLVEKIYGFDDEFKTEWFENHSDLDFKTNPVGENIFYVEDNTFNFYGYQEVIEVDGDYYKVNIYQDSKLSPSEMNEFLSDLKDFNKLNNLDPIAI